MTSPVTTRKAAGARRQVVRSASATVAGAVVVVALLGPVLGPLLTDGSPTEQVALPFAPPSPGFPLGTDHLGRDTLARVLAGGAVVVGQAMGATVLTGVVGVLLGVAAGLRGGRAGELVVRVVDVFAVVPGLLLLLVLAAGFPGSDTAVLVGVALVSLPFSVRVNRAAAVRVAGAGFVRVAVARGDGWWHVLRHDVGPSVAGTALAETGLRFVAAIYLTATAGFLGLGRGAPTPNWGRMLAENLPGAVLSAWPFAVPALLLVALAVSVNLLADDLSTTVGDRGRTG